LKAASKWLIQDYGILQKLINKFRRKLHARHDEEFQEHFRSVYLSASVDHKFLEILEDDYGNHEYKVICLDKKLEKRNKETPEERREGETFLDKYIKKNTRHFLARVGFSTKDFREAIKTFYEIKRQQTTLTAVYKIPGSNALSTMHVGTMENHMKQSMDDIQEYLDKEGITVLGSQGEYIYVNKPVDNDFLTTVDEVDKICVSDKVYYKKKGHYNGLKIKDFPSYSMNMVQMESYPFMVDAMLEEDEKEAIKIFNNAGKSIRGCPVDELVRYNKGHYEWSLITQLGEKNFIEIMPGRTEIINRENVPYFRVTNEGKTKEYKITTEGDLQFYHRGDKKVYIAIQEQIVKKFGVNRMEIEKRYRKRGKAMLDIEWNNQLELF